jgi:hypothetical protein
LWVAVGNQDGADAYILSSPDGETWTERSNPDNQHLFAVTWDSRLGLFIAVGDNGYIATSLDGGTWTQRTCPKVCPLHSVATNGDVIVAAGLSDGWDTFIVSSIDGETWYERAAPTMAACYHLVWDWDWFVGVGEAGADAYCITSIQRTPA